MDGDGLDGDAAWWRSSVLGVAGAAPGTLAGVLAAALGPAPAGGRLLDVGCGPGLASRALAAGE